MSSRFLIAVTLLILTALPAFAKDIMCSKATGTKVRAKTTVADSSENNYDVHYLKFNVAINDSSRFIRGNVLTQATVLSTQMATYTFELDTMLTIDSVKINGTLQSVVTSGGTVRKVNLGTAISQNNNFTAQVYYHGFPPAGAGFFNGVTQAISASGVNMFYTVSDPYVAKDWWPCKQALQDKIDSVDMIVTVPAGQVVGSNGLLQSVDSTTNAANWVYHWSTHYPIDYYLISLAIAPYATYNSYIHYTGSTDSTLLQNFFYDTATFVPQYKSRFDSLSLMIDYLSTLYGRYPFWKEKYGVCYTLLAGGMEHQTMTTIGTTLTPLIAHELGHQWFGDHVTYRTWPHVWLSEGFATYTEQLFVNKFYGNTAMYNYRKGQYNTVMTSVTGRVYVDDTTSVNSLFDQRLVYYKGAGVVHMLRFQAPSDSIFFALLQTYQQQFANGFATTEDLKALAAAMYGTNLDSFFNQWIYEKGYPTYAATWNQAGNTIYLKLVQTTSMPLSVATFDLPLEIKFKSGSVDTTVRVYNDQATQYYSFTWNNPVDSVFIDPNLWIIHKNGIIRRDTTLPIPIHVSAPNKLIVVPNPTNDYWMISNLQEGAQLDLYSVSGNNLWSRKSTGNTIKVPGMNLKPGNYLLRVKQQGFDDITLQLVHW